MQRVPLVSGALPQVRHGAARCATHDVADPAAAPQPFAIVGVGEIGIELEDEAHRLGARLALREVRALDPAGVTADAVQVLARVRDCPVLSSPAIGSRSQMYLRLDERVRWELGNDGLLLHRGRIRSTSSPTTTGSKKAADPDPHHRSSAGFRMPAAHACHGRLLPLHRQQRIKETARPRPARPWSALRAAPPPSRRRRLGTAPWRPGGCAVPA